MNANNAKVIGCDRLANIAAELTDAAFPVALRHGIGKNWLDLELDMWKALADTVKQRLPEWEARSL